MNRLLLLTLVFGLFGASLTGCAVNTGDDDAIMAESIQSVTTQPLQYLRTQAEQDAATARVQQLLQQPISLHEAVEIAILNNPQIQAELWSLGIAQADLRQLATIPNPGIKVTRGIAQNSTELEFGFNLLALITLPKVRDLALIEYQKMRLETAQRISGVIHETKLSYWQAVATSEVLATVERVHQATQASAELAQRMAATGNFNKLQFLREQRVLSDSTLNLLQARQAQADSLARLKQQLGLWQQSPGLKLPEQLPEIPELPALTPEAAQQQLSKRLDVQLAIMQLNRLGVALNLTKDTRLVNVFAAEVAAEAREPTERTYSLIFELPIFDRGQHRVSRQQAQYQQAFALASAIGIGARSELLQSYQHVVTQHHIARHYQQTIVPMSQQIIDENQLLYNGMFISVFELLADARSQMNDVTNSILAKRDFWIAKAQWELAQMGTPDSKFAAPLVQQPSTQGTKEAAAH